MYRVLPLCGIAATKPHLRKVFKRTAWLPILTSRFYRCLLTRSSEISPRLAGVWKEVSLHDYAGASLRDGPDKNLRCNPSEDTRELAKCLVRGQLGIDPSLLDRLLSPMMCYYTAIQGAGKGASTMNAECSDLHPERHLLPQPALPFAARPSYPHGPPEVVSGGSPPPENTAPRRAPARPRGICHPASTSGWYSGPPDRRPASRGSFRWAWVR